MRSISCQKVNNKKHTGKEEWFFYDLKQYSSEVYETKKCIQAEIIDKIEHRRQHQSSAGRVHNLRKTGVDIPRLIEWVGGGNFSKYQSFGSEMFTYSPNAKKGIVTLEKAKKNY